MGGCNGRKLAVDLGDQGIQISNSDPGSLPFSEGSNIFGAIYRYQKKSSQPLNYFRRDTNYGIFFIFI